MNTIRKRQSESTGKYRYYVLLAILCFSSVACLQETTIDTDMPLIEEQLKTKLNNVLPSLSPELRESATYIDLKNGFEYSNSGGFQKIEVGYEDQLGIVRFANGATLKKNSQLIKESDKLRLQANFTFLRGVNSVVGYNGISAEFTPPSNNSIWFNGINEAGEAGYNYLGVRSTQPICTPSTYNPVCPPGSIPRSFDAEGGTFTSAGPFYLVGKYYFYISNNGANTPLRWPTYDGYSGSTVRMSLRVLQDDKIQFTVFPLQESTSKTWIIDAVGAKASGVGAQVRKNTSLLVNNFDARFWGSFWQFGRLYQNSNASQTFFNSNLASSTTGSCASNCFPYETERINLP